MCGLSFTVTGSALARVVITEKAANRARVAAIPYESRPHSLDDQARMNSIMVTRGGHSNWSCTHICDRGQEF